MRVMKKSKPAIRDFMSPSIPCGRAVLYISLHLKQSCARYGIRIQAIQRPYFHASRRKLIAMAKEKAESPHLTLEETSLGERVYHVSLRKSREVRLKTEPKLMRLVLAFLCTALSSVGITNQYSCSLYHD